MPINTIPEKMPAGGSNPTAGAINSLDSDTGVQPCEAFKSLRVELADYGFKLVRTERHDGCTLYFLLADNTSIALKSIEEIRRFLKQLEVESIGHKFDRLKAKFNALGIALYRTDRRDGHVSFWVIAGITLQRVHTIADAEECLEQHANRLYAQTKGVMQ